VRPEHFDPKAIVDLADVTDNLTLPVDWLKFAFQRRFEGNVVKQFCAFFFRRYLALLRAGLLSCVFMWLPFGFDLSQLSVKSMQPWTDPFLPPSIAR
jgi:hypothetical protein